MTHAAVSIDDLGQAALEALEAGDLDIAASAFMILARRRPEVARHWTNLAIVEGQRGDAIAARIAFLKAILVDPRSAAGLRDLGAALAPVEEAGILSTLLRRLLCVEPFDPAARMTLVSVLFRNREWERTAREGRRALLLDPAEPDAAFFLGYAVQATGGLESSARWLRRSLVLDPIDRRGAARDLARQGASSATQAIKPGFVAELFDRYADAGFERHLTHRLGYVGPTELGRLLQEYIAERWPKRAMWAERAVDLGCGTGLAGDVLRPHCRELIGVDLSPRMVEAARARGIYDRVEAAEIVEWLSRDGASAGLVIAADVTTYIGDLVPLFTSAAARLTSDGVFALTVVEDVERRHPDGFGLSETGTYRHRRKYVEEVARQAGFEVSKVEAGAMRTEGKQPLPTLFYVFAKAGPGNRAGA